jgi:hypothetical protein
MCDTRGKKEVWKQVKKTAMIPKRGDRGKKGKEETHRALYTQSWSDGDRGDKERKKKKSSRGVVVQERKPDGIEMTMRWWDVAAAAADLPHKGIDQGTAHVCVYVVVHELEG